MNDSPLSPHALLTARPFWRSLLLIALLGLVLRMTPLAESLWLDELHTAWAIDGDWSEVAGRALLGNNDPLYFWALKLVVTLFGNDEWTLRMPSVVCGLATLISVGLLVRMWTGSGLAGCVAAFLIALDRDMVFYATEARPYAAAQLGCVALFAMTIRLWRDFQTRDAVIWGLVAGLTIHLHITTGLFVAACLPPLLLAAWGHDAWKRLAIALGIFAVCLLPLYPQLSLVYSRRQNWLTFIQSGSPFKILEILPMIPFGLIPLGIGLLANHLLPNRTAADDRVRWKAIFVWTMLATLIPLCVAWLATCFEITPLFLRRYLIGSQAMLFVWAGMNVAHVDQVAVRIVVAVAMAASIFSFHLPEHLTKQRRQDWRGAVAALDTMELPPDATLLISSRLIESDGLTSNEGPLADYCRLPITALYRPEREFRQVVNLQYSNGGKLVPWQLELLRDPHPIVVIEPGTHESAQELAVELSQSIPWATSIRILPERPGMQMLMINATPKPAGK